MFNKIKCFFGLHNYRLTTSGGSYGYPNSVYKWYWKCRECGKKATTNKPCPNTEDSWKNIPRP